MSRPSSKKRIDRLTQPTANDSACGRHAALAEDQLGRAAADVDHQPRHLGRLQVRHAGVDQPRFLAAGDDLDREAQRRLRAQQEGVAVARLAQRLRGHRAHLGRREAGQPRGKAAQAGQAALHGVFGQQALGVEPGAQAHGLLQVVDAAVAAVLQLAQFQPEAVGAHVDGGQRALGQPRSVGSGMRRLCKTLLHGPASAFLQSRASPNPRRHFAC